MTNKQKSVFRLTISMILSLGLFGLVADAHTKVITVSGTKLTDPPTIKEWIAYDVKTLHLRFLPAGGRG
ncbi:hypothetical protein CMK14_24995 [Candidatus Poribacteria bacterium]|nr:hypothetical protein [Candidatus Poribacteria bacterium]MAT78387.1 hypothetical protein [Candidatus Poribacteria bacterium]